MQAFNLASYKFDKFDKQWMDLELVSNLSPELQNEEGGYIHL